MATCVQYWKAANTAPLVRTPRLTVCCEYPGTPLPPTEVTFRLSPSYGLRTARDAHDWFLSLMHDNGEFEVETEEPGAPPLSFWSETIRQVRVE